MESLVNIKRELDGLARLAVAANEPEILVPVEWWAMISVACNDTITGADRVRELQVANNHEVTRRRSAEERANAVLVEAARSRAGYAVWGGIVGAGFALLLAFIVGL